MFRFLSIFLLFINISVYSQSYIGFDADNFNGIHGALFNPANIADSRTKVDINLVSASVFNTNNYIEVDFGKLLTDDSFVSESNITQLGINRRNNAVLNADVLGPSVLITLNKKHAIGLTTRIRSLSNINEIDGDLIDFFDTGLTTEGRRPIRKADINFTGISNNFAEIGFTYARVLKNDRVEFLKGGATLKYLRGFGGGTINVSNGVVFFDGSGDNIFLNGDVEYDFSTNLDQNNNGNIAGGSDTDIFENESRGFGFDIGFVYEYRPKYRSNISRDNIKEQKIIRHKTTYKYKIGVSILDIGFLNYKSQFTKRFSANTIDRDDLLSISGLEEIENIFTPTTSIESTRISLPTRFRAEFDLRLSEKIFLNTSTQLSLIGKNASQSNRYAHQITVSPRYETKWLTAFLPITATQYSGVQVGLGGRLGPVFIGTSGLFSRIFDNQTRAFDFYAGLKIPIFHKTPPQDHLKKEDEDPTKFSCVEGSKGKKEKKPKKLKGYGRK